MRGAGGGNHSLKIDVAGRNLVTPLGQGWDAWCLPLLSGIHMARYLAPREFSDAPHEERGSRAIGKLSNSS